jgi:hypothetical protein
MRCLVWKKKVSNNGTHGEYNFNDNKGGHINNNGVKEIYLLKWNCFVFRTEVYHAWIAADERAIFFWDRASAHFSLSNRESFVTKQLGHGKPKITKTYSPCPLNNSHMAVITWNQICGIRRRSTQAKQCRESSTPRCLYPAAHHIETSCSMDSSNCASDVAMLLKVFRISLLPQ